MFDNNFILFVFDPRKLNRIIEILLFMELKFYFIGHRGTRVDYDENTLIAFEKAFEFGANYIEFDVRKNRGGKLFVIHDNSIDRTTHGTGLLKELSLHEMRNYKTKNNRQNISQLSEVLTVFQNKIKFMIELKEKNLRTDVLNLVSKRISIKDCIFSGRSIKELELIKAEHPETKVCYNITKGKDLTLSEFLVFEHKKPFPFKIDMISLRSSMITPEFITTCQKNHIKALSWDFLGYENPINKIQSLINMGIDGILFDNYKNISKIKKWFNYRTLNNNN